MSKDKKLGPPSSGFSRRDFLRGGTLGAVSGGLLSRGLVPKKVSAAGPELLGPGPVPFKLEINGRLRELNLAPRVTLLDALRDHLDLTGAKKVCDRTSCGACTVLVDGKPVYACTVLAIEAQGKAIQTVEGLGSVDELHPIQAAFVDNDAQQCGFCTPGFVMAAKALLDRKPDPTLEDIHEGLGGNICRCGTYAGLRKAVLQVAGAGKGGA